MKLITKKINSLLKNKRIWSSNSKNVRIYMRDNPIIGSHEIKFRQNKYFFNFIQSHIL